MNKISIHAPRVGSDPVCFRFPLALFLFQSTLPVWGATFLPSVYAISTMLFQSTLPVWGATGYVETKDKQCVISIHAPRVGSDRIRNLLDLPVNDFNPRSPCGERLASTFRMALPMMISIHAPRVGSDPRRLRPGLPARYFNPRSPWGERRTGTQWKHPAIQFQSTLPVWGATGCIPRRPLPVIFQSTLPVWGATIAPKIARPAKAISIHAPRVGSDL